MSTLEDVYARLPDVGCKGLCTDACGPIGCSELEAERMREASGKPLTADRNTLSCGYLVDGRCSVYSARPLLCRLFGAGSNRRMVCPWGCKPARRVNDTEADALFRQVEKIGGPRTFARIK